MMRLLVQSICMLAAEQALHAQTTQPQTAPAPAADQAALDPVDWSSLDEQQRAHVMNLLQSPDWPIRVFGLLRLERYRGDAVREHLGDALRDQAWQVRCFALRQAGRMSIEITPSDLASENDARVIRAALRCGIGLPEGQYRELAARLLRTKGLEELMLGLEIAAACSNEGIRADAAKRAERLIKSMDDAVAALISRRLAVVLDAPIGPAGTPMETAIEWHAWLKARSELKLAAPGAAATPGPKPNDSPSLIATIEDETFVRLLDYLAFLKARDLDLVIVMDSTASMIPMVNQARAGVDALILFLSDISRRMRLAFIVYRDHDNPPACDGHPFTTDIAAIRDFLFKVRITGGADYPEAVLAGLTACSDLDWNKKAERQIVLVGDAPPHAEDIYRVRALMDSYRDSGITVHAVHVPMQYPAGHYDRLTIERALADKQWLETYNAEAARAFEDIARAGGGRKTAMRQSDELVPAVMRLTIDEAWWPVFEQFYAMYLQLCR